MENNHDDYYVITETGEVYSRAERNPRRGRLEEIRKQLLAQRPLMDEAGALLLEKLLARASTILVQLESLAFQQDTFERNVRAIEEQISRAQSRYSELPESTAGTFPQIDIIRQHILTEKQNLLHELRQLRTAHAEHQQRSIAALSDAYAEYCSANRSLAALTGRAEAAELPTLTDLIDFLVPRDLQGGKEVVILHPPRIAGEQGQRRA